MDRLINENAVLSAIGEWIAHNEHTYTNATEYLRNRVKAIKTAEQEPCRETDDYENEIEDLQNRLDIAEYDKERLREEVTNLEGKIKALEQEPTTKENLVVGDAISRQAVLALAKEECDTAIIPYRRFVKDINALPSVTPQPKTEWIPVSERLPEKSGLYLVTNRANEIEVFSFTGHDMARVFWGKYAKAWMPLPEPYKPKE